MTREVLMQNTVGRLSKLPNEKLKEVSDFTEFLLDKLENQHFNDGILKVATSPESFKFLEYDEDLYTADDVKEKY